MKRLLWLAAFLMIAIGVVASRGQGPGAKSADGPGAGGATLKLPGLEPAPNATPASPGPVPYYLKDKIPTTTSTSRPKGAGPIALPPSANVDINKDIEVTPQAGQWMIFVMSYSGPESPQMARKFALALRETYKLNAFVFNYGAKEKQAEYERVQKIRQKQIEELQKAGVRGEVPFRIAAVKIEEQSGVLIGGYRTFEEASNDLKNRIKKLDPAPLKGKVDLDMWFVSNVKQDQQTKKVNNVDLDNLNGLGYVNPFKRAFPARNPALPKESGASAEEDLKFLQHLNREEKYTLLQCRKPFTLVISQFNMQTKKVADTKEAKSFLEKFERGFFVIGQKPWEDIAAHNAHELAEGLRKCGLQETYVLHCRNCSFVTVGGFESLEDPRLASMQNWLETYLKNDAFDKARVPRFPRPVPMPVPGVGALKSN